jgi:hypothetical protein
MIGRSKKTEPPDFDLFGSLHMHIVVNEPESPDHPGPGMKVGARPRYLTLPILSLDDTKEQLTIPLVIPINAPRYDTLHQFTARLGVGAEKRSKSGGNRTDMQPCFVGLRYGDTYISRYVEPYRCRHLTICLPSSLASAMRRKQAAEGLGRSFWAPFGHTAACRDGSLPTPTRRQHLFGKQTALLAGLNSGFFSGSLWRDLAAGFNTYSSRCLRTAK